MIVNRKSLLMWLVWCNTSAQCTHLCGKWNGNGVRMLAIAEGKMGMDRVTVLKYCRWGGEFFIDVYKSIWLIWKFIVCMLERFLNWFFHSSQITEMHFNFTQQLQLAKENNSPHCESESIHFCCYWSVKLTTTVQFEQINNCRCCCWGFLISASLPFGFVHITHCLKAYVNRRITEASVELFIFKW